MKTTNQSDSNGLMVMEDLKTIHYRFVVRQSQKAYLLEQVNGISAWVPKSIIIDYGTTTAGEKYVRIPMGYFQKHIISFEGELS